MYRIMVSSITVYTLKLMLKAHEQVGVSPGQVAKCILIHSEVRIMCLYWEMNTTYIENNTAAVL